tara:strand:+ start:12487 stop:13596 length:1110 start_codon:yes stop_codon:yes gene_type:complete
MKFKIFELERNQSLHENDVDYNLSESGVHPLKLSEILFTNELKEIVEKELSYGYTNGSPKLRDLIAKMYGTPFSRDNVLITSGSAEANFLSVMTQLDRGDELIYMLPNYPQIMGLAKSFGIKLKPLQLKENLDWQWDVNELNSMVTKKTKMIAVCNPNNPTGSIMNAEVMDGIIDICKETDSWLLSDEVYRGAELNGVECRSFAGATNKTIVNSGLSKAYSLPGLRLGWTIGSKDYINKAWAFHDYTVINVATLSDWVACKIMEKNRRKDILNRTKSHLNRNIDILCNWSKDFSQLIIKRPQAAAIVFAKLNTHAKSEDFVNDLRNQKSVMLTAGKWHGLEGYIRIGYGVPEDYLKLALKRLGSFLDSL